MRMETAHIRVPAPAADVFDYVADVGNLPEWSTEFIQEYERHGDELRATTGMGKATIRIHPDQRTGVVDILLEPDDGEPGLFPARVVPLGESCVFMFTMFQAPDQAVERFEAERASLERELENIPDRFER